MPGDALSVTLDLRTLIELGGAIGVVVTCAMFIKGVEAKADSAKETAVKAETKADAAANDLAAFQAAANEKFAPAAEVRALSDRVERGFTELRSSIRDDLQELRRFLLGHLDQNASKE